MRKAPDGPAQLFLPGFFPSAVFTWGSPLSVFIFTSSHVLLLSISISHEVFLAFHELWCSNICFVIITRLSVASFKLLKKCAAEANPTLSQCLPMSKCKDA